MQRVNILIIGDHQKRVRSLTVPRILLPLTSLLGFAGVAVLGYLALDYLHLRSIRDEFHSTQAENQHLRGEAQILMGHLGEVRESLQKVQDHSDKLNELVNARLTKLSSKTGIGPLSAEEYSLKSQEEPTEDLAFVPPGINVKNLHFGDLFKEVDTISEDSKIQALKLQQLLSTLSQKKSLLSTIPSIAPVQGWMASHFGYRISPFTGERTFHRGVDIAAPIGTPIMAPAKGVVIFSGKKAGFGNFIMIAHYGSGIITRYGHNAQNFVRAGQTVERGDRIGSVGDTGRTTGPHVHYEVWRGGHAMNPKKFILGNSPDVFTL